MSTHRNQQAKMKNISLILVIATTCASCCNYQREEHCHLDQWGISGDVVKIETIVQSSIPLTELFAASHDPQYVIFGGNTCVEFDRHGNVKRFVGYGIEGELLFDESNYRHKKGLITTPGLSIRPDKKCEITHIESTPNEIGDIINVKYYEGENLIWDQYADYNEDGTIHSIVTVYETLCIRTSLVNIIRADTTRFHYLSYDSKKNWTDVMVTSTGVFPFQKHSYKMKRQITYWGEGEEYPLIKSLPAYNRVIHQSIHRFNSIQLGQYGNLRIPNYMKIKTQSEIDEVDAHRRTTSDLLPQSTCLLMAEYDGNDSFASIVAHSVFTGDYTGFDNLSTDELQYNKDIDADLEESINSELAINGTYILKWLPYEYTYISGKRALKIRYYRYGIGSPIPVYCEGYTIPMRNGYSITLLYSFQSNHEFKFRNDFEEVIKSTKLRKPNTNNINTSAKNLVLKYANESQIKKDK